jgi:hypothetical protein
MTVALSRAADVLTPDVLAPGVLTPAGPLLGLKCCTR